MPYRHAHWYLLALFPLAGLAFWQSYLSQFTSASAEFHAHGLTASAWLILLVMQSWTVHHGRRQTHRTVGTASLVLFPLFLMGGAGIFFGMADRFAAGSPFHVLYAPNLVWLDVVGVGGFAYFYYEALRQRRKVHPHSGYLLATAIMLLPPIFGRLMAIPLGVTGPEDFGKLGTGFQIANADIDVRGICDITTGRVNCNKSNAVSTYIGEGMGLGISLCRRQWTHFRAAVTKIPVI